MYIIIHISYNRWVFVYTVFLVGPKLSIGLLKPHLYSKPLLNSIELNHHFSIDFEGNLPWQ